MATFASVVMALLVLQFSSAQDVQMAVVRFNARGISGYIRFTEMGENVKVEASLQGLTGNHGWHVHELPVDQTLDPAVQCLSDSVGPHYDPFNRNTGTDYTTRCANDPMECEAGDLAGKLGRLNSTNQPFSRIDNTSTLFLRNQYSIIGRSVVIHRPDDNANFVCGTIRSAAEMSGAGVSLLQSSFVNPVGGTIYFRQVEGEDVQIWGKLYWTDDSPTTLNHNWHIHVLAPGEEYRMGVCNTSTNILGHYRPLGNGPTSNSDYSTVCGPNRTQGCEVGDLTGKHDTVTVQASSGPYRMGSFFYTDNFLNLTGVNPVLNRSVAIHQPERGGPVIACAPLVESENIVLTQYGVRDLTLSQQTPFEDVVITSTGTRMETTVQDFAFNQLALNCLPFPSSIFSPYELVQVEAPGLTTPDKFSVGALQSRYSEINEAATVRAFDVPIYGARNSITSLNLRTVSSEGSVCSGLMPPLTGTGTILAKASFSRVLRGAVYLIQEDFGSDQLGNTHVIVDVYYANSNTPATTNHNWHVHVSPSPDNTTSCSPTVGGHYNPFMVSLATASTDPVSMNSDYSTDCSPRYQLRCESGDLGSKHGRLSISPDGATRPTFTYVDSNLQLSGSSSIIGRSIAVHDIIENAPIFDCGTIEEVYASDSFVIRTDPDNMLRTALTSMLAGEVEGVEPTDIIILNQQVYSVNSDFLCVNVSLRVLANSLAMANSYATMLSGAADNLFNCTGAVDFVTPTTMATDAMATDAMATGGAYSIHAGIQIPFLLLLMAALYYY